MHEKIKNRSKIRLEFNFHIKMFVLELFFKRLTVKIIFYFFAVLFFLSSTFLHGQNVPPVLTDIEEIERVSAERDKVFSSLISDPTNLDNLFEYANLSILIGDLEAAIGVFEQMLFYQPNLPRIRLELGVLYFLSLIHI